MLICPFDMSWCLRPDCLTGVCHRATDDPLAPCEGCGALIVRRIAHVICVECVEVPADDQRSGA